MRTLTILRLVTLTDIRNTLLVGMHSNLFGMTNINTLKVWLNKGLNKCHCKSLLKKNRGWVEVINLNFWKLKKNIS